ncbi:MAG: hypothetical protein ACYC8T_06025 [Myxococcaceae bacterium]
MARKISETILDFASPLLNALGNAPSDEQVRTALSIAIAAWNAATLDAWKPENAEAEALRRSIAAADESHRVAMLALVESLLERKRTGFAHDLRAVGKWEVLRTETGSSLSADAYLPSELAGAKDA